MNRKEVLILSIVLFFSGIAIFGLMTSQPQAQIRSEEDYKDHLQRLWDTDTLFYMGFKHLIDGIYIGWDIPEEIESKVT